jgi:DNA-binding GntR family transcriptional regulator
MERDVREVNVLPALPGLAEITPALLPSVIYRQLHADIVSGVLVSGQPLRQEELARRFNVSRVPLREALTRLEAVGLIEQRPRRGYAVAELDASAIVDVFELRMVIEQHAGAVAARSRGAEDIAAVGELLERMRTLDRARADYAQQWTTLNYQFHQRIISSSRRKTLVRVASNLRDSVEPYVNIEVSMTHSFDASEIEHREIFEAFKAGDADGLAELSRKHVESTSRRLLQVLRESALKPRR